MFRVNAGESLFATVLTGVGIVSLRMRCNVLVEACAVGS